MKRLLISAFMLSLFVVATTFEGCSSTDSTVDPNPIDTSKVFIGTLFSASGNWRDLGQSAVASMVIAINEMNDSLRANGSKFRLAIRDEDTQLDPVTALEKIQELNRDSVCFVLGPQSSTEASYVLDYANLNKMILVSPSSTASNLAIPNDYLLRLAPGEAAEAHAVALAMYAKGIRHVISVSADDSGNMGLTTRTGVEFLAMGAGTTFADPEKITTSTEYSELVSTLSSSVRQLKLQYPTESIGVVVNGFDNVASLFAFATDSVDLGSVAWFAGDGVAQNSAISNSTAASLFAIKVNLQAAVFDITDQVRTKYAHLIDTVTHMTGFAPNAYALSCYDAVRLIGWAYMSAGRYASHETLKTEFINLAETFDQVTGPMKLDANGDRVGGNFSFYTVYQKQNGYYAWHAVTKK
jgi:branched-chain amino acid transport system substrate-binding protein